MTVAADLTTWIGGIDRLAQLSADHPVRAAIARLSELEVTASTRGIEADRLAARVRRQRYELRRLHRELRVATAAARTQARIDAESLCAPDLPALSTDALARAVDAMPLAPSFNPEAFDGDRDR